MHTRPMVKAFLFVVSCAFSLMTSPLVPSLHAAPIYRPSDIFPGERDTHGQIVLALPNTVDLYSSGSTPSDTGSYPDSQLKGAILFLLLAGGTLKCLTSATVRRFFQDTFDPLNWNSYQ